jgi:dCTP deaminase
MAAMPGDSLFPTSDEKLTAPPRSARRESGVLPSQDIRELLVQGAVRAATPVDEGQIQPASIDLRLGATAHRIPASFLPGHDRPVRGRLADLSMYAIDLREGAVLEAGCIYLVELQESLRLPRGVSGVATPKSSTGRLDIFTRLLTESAAEFETVPSGYAGPLYLEICPRSFSVIARAGTRLNQLRFRRGDSTASDAALKKAHEAHGLVAVGAEDPRFHRGLRFSVDLVGRGAGETVVYRAKRHARAVIDLARIGAYEPSDFWEAVTGPLEDGLVLYPDEFYILATVELVRVPPHLSAEMVAYDTNIGEFRVHYAGFFDPGFGWDEGDPAGGTPAVLEVRAHETPFLLEHGQEVGRLAFEYLLDRPDRIYGTGIGSNYARQGLTLAKQFRR